MNPSEADDLAVFLRRCFRTMTDEQMRAIARNLEHYDRAPAFEAIQRHVGRFEFVNGKALFEEIDGLSAQANRQRRVDAAATLAAERAERIRKEHQTTEACMDKQKQIDELIAKLTDAGLAEWMEYAFDRHPTLNAAGKAFMRKMKPRESPLIKGMVYDAIQKSEKERIAAVQP